MLKVSAGWAARSSVGQTTAPPSAARSYAANSSAIAGAPRSARRLDEIFAPIAVDTTFLSTRGNYQIGPRDIVTWRTDYMHDTKGQRTGFKSRYAEFDLGDTHWVGDTIESCPEIRFEHAREAEAYDNPTATSRGGKHSQATIAADAVFHF